MEGGAVGKRVSLRRESPEDDDAFEASRALAKEYLAYLSVERGSSALTVGSYASDLDDYAAFLADVRGCSAGCAARSDVAAYARDLAERGYAPASRERRMAAVRGMHRFLAREGLARGMPPPMSNCRMCRAAFPTSCLSRKPRLCSIAITGPTNSARATARSWRC